MPRGAQLWMPVVPVVAATSPAALDNVGVLFVLGRLRPGVTRDAAREESRAFVDGASRARRRREPGTASRADPVRRLHGWTGAAGACGLCSAPSAFCCLISCANVSGLMLARTSIQRRDHAIRLALGATAVRSRARDGSSKPCCSPGRAARWASTRRNGSCARSSRWHPPTCPDSREVSIDPPVAAFTAVTVIATALLCGLGPVRQAVSTNLVESGQRNRPRHGQPPHRRVRSTLVAAQIGLSVVLVGGVRTDAAELPQSSSPRPRLLSGGRVDDECLRPKMRSRPRANGSTISITRLQRIPHVEAAGAVFLPPLALGAIGQETRVLLEGQPDTPAVSLQNPALNYEVATRGYFAAMKIALEAGPPLRRA